MRKEGECMQVRRGDDFFPYIMRSESTVESLKMDTLLLEGLELLNELFACRSRVLLPLTREKHKLKLEWINVFKLTFSSFYSKLHCSLHEGCTLQQGLIPELWHGGRFQ